MKGEMKIEKVYFNLRGSSTGCSVLFELIEFVGGDWATDFSCGLVISHKTKL
jgi:hypothetical protein